MDFTITKSSPAKFNTSFAVSTASLRQTLATVQQINKAYRSRLLVVHPDKPGGSVALTNAAERAKEILLHIAEFGMLVEPPRTDGYFESERKA